MLVWFSYSFFRIKEWISLSWFFSHNFFLDLLLSHSLTRSCTCRYGRQPLVSEASLPNEIFMSRSRHSLPFFRDRRRITMRKHLHVLAPLLFLRHREKIEWEKEKELKKCYRIVRKAWNAFLIPWQMIPSVFYNRKWLTTLFFTFIMISPHKIY